MDFLWNENLFETWFAKADADGDGALDLEEAVDFIKGIIDSNPALKSIKDAIVK